MSDAIVRLLKDNSRAFSERDFEEVMTHFQLPTRVVVCDLTLDLKSVSIMSLVTTAFRQKLADQGVEWIEKTLLSHQLDRTGASLCEVEYRLFDADGEFLDAAPARYRCQIGFDGPLIVQVEYPEIPLGLTMDDFAFLAAAA